MPDTMFPIRSEPHENACPINPLMNETALLNPVEIVVWMPEIVDEIPDFIDSNALVAAERISLLRFVTVDFMKFQPEEITDRMPETTDEILLLIAIQIDDTTEWIVERVVEITFWIAIHAEVIRVWIPVSSGERNDTIAFQIDVTEVRIAVSTVEIASWMAVHAAEKPTVGQKVGVSQMQR